MKIMRDALMGAEEAIYRRNYIESFRQKDRYPMELWRDHFWRRRSNAFYVETLRQSIQRNMRHNRK